jgi:hypothetical protein
MELGLTIIMNLCVVYIVMGKVDCQNRANKECLSLLFVGTLFVLFATNNRTDNNVTFRRVHVVIVVVEKQ